MSAKGRLELSGIDTHGLATAMAKSSPYLIVDVGSADRFLHAHVPTSVFMEPDQAAQSVDRWVEAADSVAVVVCDDGDGAAENVAGQLRMRGFQNTRWLKGGFPAWMTDGRPTVIGWMPIAHGLGTTLLTESCAAIVTPAELEGLVAASKTLVIDVRTADEHVRSTIPGAHNIPVGELAAAADDLRHLPVDRIVVHCAGRTRGAAAGALLCDLGLRNVAILDGGTAAWVKDGRPLVEGQGPPRKLGMPAGAYAGTRGPEDVHRLRVLYETKTISAGSFAKRLAARKSQPIYAIDVRQRTEYEVGHVPGSIWRPAGEVAPSVDDLVPVRNAAVVFVSTHGVRATVADLYYRRIGGFESLVLKGGMDAWQSLGLPVERGLSPERPATLREREGARIRAQMQRQDEDASAGVKGGLGKAGA